MLEGPTCVVKGAGVDFNAFAKALVIESSLSWMIFSCHALRGEVSRRLLLDLLDLARLLIDANAQEHQEDGKHEKHQALMASRHGCHGWKMTFFMPVA